MKVFPRADPKKSILRSALKNRKSKIRSAKQNNSAAWEHQQQHHRYRSLMKFPIVVKRFGLLPPFSMFSQFFGALRQII